jgi:hypothetical protein
VKIVNGKIFHPHFRKTQSYENYDRIVAVLDKNYSRKELFNSFSNFCKRFFSVQKIGFSPASGLRKGNITYRMLWKLFPYNNKIIILKLNRNEYQKIARGTKAEHVFTKIAIGDYYAYYFIKMLNIPPERIKKSEETEISMLLKWIKQKVK